MKSNASAKPTRIWCERPGYYATRLVKGGPLLPCQVAAIATPDPWDRDNRMVELTPSGEGPSRPPMLYCWVGDRLVEGPTPKLIEPRIGYPITAAVWSAMMRRLGDARRRGPDQPEANPTQSVDFSALDVPF